MLRPRPQAHRDPRKSSKSYIHRYSAFTWMQDVWSQSNLLSETWPWGKFPGNSAKPGFHPITTSLSSQLIHSSFLLFSFSLLCLHCLQSDCKLFQGKTSSHAKANKEQFHWSQRSYPTVNLAERRGESVPLPCIAEKHDKQQRLFMPCQKVPVLEFTAMQVKQTPEEYKR